MILVRACIPEDHKVDHQTPSLKESVRHSITSPQTTTIWLAGLTLAALASRLALISTRILVENDGPFYVALAEQILAGNWSGALNDYWSQFYPVTIAFVGLLVPDVEFSARLVSGFCGAALVPATWMLVNEIADPLSAGLAAILVAFQPWLVAFSVFPLTEMLFALLMMIALIVTLRAACQGNLWRFALAGCMIALAILTRPEGLLLVVVLLGAVTARFIRNRSWQVIREGILAFVVLLLVMAPQSIGTYNIHGHFNFLWKSSISLALGESFNDPSRAEQAANSLTHDGNRQLNHRGYESGLIEYWLNRFPEAIQRVQQNLVKFRQEQANVNLLPIPYIPGLPAISIWILAAAGLAKGMAGDKRGRTLSMFAFITAYGLGLFSVLVHPRLLIPLVPLILVFTAMGCIGLLQTAQWIYRYFDSSGSPPIATRIAFWAGSIGLLLLVSSSLLEVHTVLDSFFMEPVAGKEAGLWLRDHAPQTEKILSHNPQTPFYFYDDWPFEKALPIPWASPEDVLIYAHRNGVEYIVLEEWVIQAAHYPVETWLGTDQPVSGLELVEVFGVAPYRVIIYRCIY
jgi:4-amino-4-deoxy-L-arabinose transferase-like glycosyltransferase